MVQRWIVAALRNRKFFELGTLNQAIAELRDRLNHRPFKKREGSRWDLFCQLDRPVLRPLPAQPYCFGDWKTLRVNIDYHVELERHYYSVPYQLIGQQVDARWTATTVEIFHRGLRVASHARSTVPYAATTQDAHRPKSHRAHLEWTPARIIEWAATTGPATAKLVETILAVSGSGRRGQNGSARRGPRRHMAVAVEVSAASRESGRSFSSCADLVPQIRSGTHREQNGPTAPRRGEKEIPNQRWVRVDLRWNLGFALNRMLTSAQERIAVLSRAGASGSQYSHGPFL